MLLHDIVGDSELVQLKQGFVMWNSACVKLGLHCLQVRQSRGELLLCPFLAWVTSGPRHDQGPLRTGDGLAENEVQPWRPCSRKTHGNVYKESKHDTCFIPAWLIIPRAGEGAVFNFRVSFPGWMLELYSPLHSFPSGSSCIVQINLVWPQ